MQRPLRWSIPANNGRGWRRSKRLRQWHAFRKRSCERKLQGLAQALMAIGTRQSRRRRSRHPGRFPFRGGRAVGPLLCLLLVRYGEWRRSVYRRSQRLGWGRRYVVCLSDHGGYSSAHQPARRCTPGQSKLCLLQASGCGVRLRGQQFLQLLERPRHRQRLCVL